MPILSKNLKPAIKIILGMLMLPVLFIIYFYIRVFFPLFFPSTNGCKNVTPFPNPLYKQATSTSDKGFHQNSNFGKKEEKIYRISETGAFDSQQCMPIKEADPATFIVLNQYNAKDKNNAYIQFYNIGKHAKKNKYIIPNIDSSTFKALGPDGIYTKDKNHAYYKTQVLEKIDPTTFKLLEYNGRTLFAKDKNKVYKTPWGDKPSELIDADTTTFQVLNEKYAKDKNHVYTSEGKIIKSADQLTFNIVNEGICYSSNGGKIVCPKKYDAWDKSSKYKEGKKITQEEINTTTDGSYEAYTFNPIKKILLRNSLIIKGESWEIARVNNDIGAIELKTGPPPKENSNDTHTTVISLKVDVPSNADAIKFVYKFPEDNNGRRNMIEAFLNTEQVFSDKLHQLVYRYPKNGWRESKFSKKIKQYRGKKITISFRLSKILDNDNAEGHILIDSIIFGKIDKVTNIIPRITHKEFPNDYRGKLSPSKRNQQIKEIKEMAKHNIELVKKCNQKHDAIRGTVGFSDGKMFVCPPEHYSWPYLNDICGENRSDQEWIVSNKNKKWSYTLKCTQHPECSSWDNLKCTEDGCIFSDECFYN